MATDGDDAVQCAACALELLESSPQGGSLDASRLLRLVIAEALVPWALA